MLVVESTSRSRAPRARTALLMALALVVMATGVTGVGPWAQPVPAAATAVPAGTPADGAARWLATQVVDSTVTTGGVPDPGLAADVALALTAAGHSGPAAATLTTRLLDRSAEYLSPSGAGQVVAGAAAKLLLLAAARGMATDELRARLIGTLVVEPGGTSDGRFRDRPPTSAPSTADRSNTFSQAVGVLALARTGTVPPAAVDFLLDQQCPGGGFRLFPTGGRNCTTDVATDVDATALAVVAIAATAPAAGSAGDDALGRALDRLEALQLRDGAFTSSGPGATANANSTGLAGHALRVSGRDAAADRSAGWLTALQLGCAPVAGDAGAVAFTPAALAAADQGIPARTRDQFRRATSQALLAFVEVPLGAAGAPADAVAPCGPSSTSTTLPGPSTTGPTTAPSTTGPTTTSPGSPDPGSTGGNGSTTTTAPAVAPIPVNVLGEVESAAPEPERSAGAAADRNDRNGTDRGDTGVTLALTGASSRRAIPFALAALAVGAACSLAASRLRRSGRRSGR